MNVRVGVILLDGAELVVGVFTLDRDIRWTKLYYQVRDLTTSENQGQTDYLGILETLAEVLLFGIKLNIKNWKILTRNLEDEIVKQISQATKLKIRSLDLKDEQELICRGVLSTVVF